MTDAGVAIASTTATLSTMTRRVAASRAGARARLALVCARATAPYPSACMMMTVVATAHMTPDT